MRIPLSLLLLGVAMSVGCSGSQSNRPLPVPGGPDGTVIVVDDDRAGPASDRRGGANRARSVRVPPGHYPPPGQCRVWYPGRPPGQQPRAQRCEQLRGRVPYGAFILYNGRAWDTRYDWRGHERRNRGSVPEVILHLVSSFER